MARTHAQPTPSLSQSLAAHRRECVACGGPLWSAYWQERSILTLSGWLRLSLQIRRCTRYGCALFGRPYRPEEEGGSALPHGEIGLDVIASVGAQRFGEHRSVPEIHRALITHGLGRTADEWPAIRTAFGWLHQAAHLLNNSSERNVCVLR